VFGVLSAKAAIFAKSKFFFHFFLVALGIMRDTTTHTALEFHQSIFDLSHTSLQLFNYLPTEKPFHFTGKYCIRQYATCKKGKVVVNYYDVL
jgi:hypothetical protein